MNVVKLSLIALAVAAASSQLAVAGEQQESKGFIADSTLNLLNRNFWMHRDYRNSTSNIRDEWAHGIQAHYVSGFTQGTVGFGVDAHGYGGIKLDGGRGSVGNGILPVDGEGRIEDNTGELGGAVKLRVSSSVLKFGEQRPTAPVFATGDSRLLPETATGFQLSSSEFDVLSLEAGHFTAINRRNSSNSDGELTSEYAEVEARSVDFVGGTYNFTDNLSVAVYGSEAEDVWRQYFANVDYTGGDSIWLANSVQYSDFNAPNERSVHVRYDLNMATFGVPGLSFMARYIKGDDIDGTKADPNGAFAGWAGDDEKHWERDLEAKYVVQSGAAKDLSLRVRQATHRSTAFDSDLDEVRLIVEYPLSIL